MSYPASSEVQALQRTMAADYNNLRKDALHLGQASTDAVNLLALLARFSQWVRLEYLATNKVRVPYAGNKPPVLIVNGYMLKATAHVDSATVSGAAGTYYVFANRTAGSTTFTLSVSTSPTEGTDQRLIGSFYFDGANIDQGSVRNIELERPGYVFVGLEAEKSASPAQGDIYIATDTNKVYACFTAPAWTQIGGGVTKLSGSGIQNYGEVSVSSGGGAFGSWVQVSASTAAAIYLLSYRTKIDSGVVTLDFHLQIGVGGAGAETVISELALGQGVSSSPPSVSVGNLPAPLPVAAGTRLAVRVKAGAGTPTFLVVLGYCNQADLVSA